MVKLGILKWGDYPGLYQWAQCNKGPYKGEAEITVRGEDAMMSTSWSDEAISQGLGAFLEDAVGKEIDSPLKIPEVTGSANALILAL